MTAISSSQVITPRVPLHFQLWRQYRAGIGVMRHGRLFSTRRAALTFIYTLTAFLIDAATTIYAISTGIGEEANPLAAFLFHTVGYVGWIMVGVCLFFLPMAFCLTRPKFPLTWGMSIMVYVLVSLKIFAGISNLILIIRYS